MPLFRVQDQAIVPNSFKLQQQIQEKSQGMFEEV